MNEHAALIEAFYRGFQERNADAMAACYHADIQFADPVFPDLRGERAGAMWRMLCERGTDLTVEFSNVHADDVGTGSAHWDATYTFTATGRLVHNRIDATFRFADGKIIEHRDHFNLWKWCSMALGPVGAVLGWTPIVRGKLRRTANTQLEKYMKGGS